MATTSRVPAAITELLAILRAAPALNGVRVVDGPEPTNLSDRQFVFVGWQPGADAAVQLVQAYLDRIAAYDKRGPALNAITVVNGNALARAAELDAELARTGRLTHLSVDLSDTPGALARFATVIGDHGAKALKFIGV